MRQLVLEKIVVSGFPPVNKRCLWLKGNTFYFWYKGAWRSVDSNIEVNEDYIDEKVNEVVSEEIIKVIGDAPEEYDTLGEFAKYAAEHEIEAEKRDINISANTEAIKTLEDKVANGSGTPSSWEGFE